MIIWLASYPKSGNTWLRALFSTYYYSLNNNPFENLRLIQKFPNISQFQDLVDINLLKKDKTEISKHWITAQERINLQNKTTFLKTHNFAGTINGNQFSNNNNTLGVIYIVRDPRSVAVSMAYHDNSTFEKSINNLLDTKRIVTDSQFISEFRTSWKIHYLSWTKLPIPKMIVKYEDLILDTHDTFKKVLEFVKKFIAIEINEEKIKKIIEICKFENLSKLENKLGFNEIEKKENINFFRSGKIDDWKEKLNKTEIEKIEKIFNDEMIELKYL